MPQEAIQARITTKLVKIYGEAGAAQIKDALFALIDDTQIPPPENSHLSHRDIILIAYGDQVSTGGETPLYTLHHFLHETLQGTVNSVHLLPFYPFSSDDGFSVIDYYAVDPRLGTWDDIRAFSDDFALMFDAVFNHISAKSEWFQAFLRQEPPYDEYFVTVPPNTDVSAVVRPRALPLLTAFDTANGEKLVWTTFSPDQVDLNFANPRLLLDMLRILLFYVEQGATLIRLDAIAFLWKVPGTTSIHLDQTHLIIQLMRDVLDSIAPHVVLITETNVPHEENISYFGDGSNEAQMVYNFALPPLVLHTMHTGDATKLSKWAATLKRVGNRTTYFNFTASHDGIGMRPATGILSQAEIDALVQLAHDHGGRVSYRNQSDGTQVPYELNITYFDAITAPEITESDPSAAVKRFAVSQSIALTLMGVPGIYFHSLFGSRNYAAGVEQTGHNRTINREKLTLETLQDQLAADNSLRSRVFKGYSHMLAVRSQESAFDPFGEQEILTLSPYVFAIRRFTADNRNQIIALHNVVNDTLMFDIPVKGSDIWADLLSDEQYTVFDGTLQVVLEPYQILWLKPQKEQSND